MKIRILKFRLFLVLFVFVLVTYACGPTAREREELRLEDSIELDQERRQLMERTGQILDSSQTQVADTL